MKKNNSVKNVNTQNNNFKFDVPYNKQKWAEHFGENFKEEYGSVAGEDEIIEKNKDFLNKIIWIGDLNINENEVIGVFEVYIKNTRLASRVKISRICSRILMSGSYGKGIFFILYEDNKNNYRVSYVKHDKTGIKGENGLIIMKDDYSNPKRYTFLLGEGIKVHTPASRITSDIFGSVESIENAFSVEGVNKEFYKGVKEYFEKIHNDIIKYFDKDENKAKEFALRFLGRVLFCWFLREKELIPNEILNSGVFENLKYKKNYYSDVLEDLFFNVLNMDMEKRKFSKERVIYNYEKAIPFLNGGLFSKKEDDEAVKSIDDEIIKGLFEFFEMYNFTVDESAPFDVDISIDPEMLGRIFENLLAEINPETQKNAREEKGSFYTPREIVDYMVTEAIKLYLYKKMPNTDKSKIDGIFDVNERVEYNNEERKGILENIHDMIILDPACGSGAFPLGILQRVFDIINKLDPEHEFYKNSIIDKLPPVIKDEFNRLYSNKKYNYAYKLGILQKMIHGVDIQPIAIEISRLRAFLSLIVEEKKNIKKNNLGIEALPNLEFHFICTNSLIKLMDEKNISDTFTKLIFNGLIENMQEISKKFFEAYTKDKKQAVYTEFEAFKYRVSKIETLDQETNDIKENIISWNPFSNSPSKFFNHNIQFGIKKDFDIIIGNPPYGAKISSKEKKYFENNYLTARTKKTTKELLKGSLNTYSLFIEKSISLLENNGILVFITPISIIASDSMALLHSLLEEKCELIKISNYADRPKQIFKDASVCVSILECIKTDTANKNILSTKMYRKSNEDTIQDILNELEFIDVKEFKLLGRYPKISKQIEVNILRKLFKIKNSIGSLIKDKGNPIYYRMAGGRYFKVITNYSTTKAASEKVIYFDKKIANTIGAILSSNLYFWYYQIFSDNLNMKKYDIESFKIPIDKLDNNKIKHLEKMYSQYLTDIEKNVIIHGNTNYKNITSFKEYKIRMSKNIIDEIDDFICPLYGLTEEEIDFIKNYEIKYRIDDKED